MHQSAINPLWMAFILMWLLGRLFDRTVPVLHGREAAEEAIKTTVDYLTSDRVRRIEHQIYEGSPAEALLAAAGDNPAKLIVVGNRGLGAVEGDLLGAVPRAVVKGAVCDVLIVQDTRDTPDLRSRFRPG